MADNPQQDRDLGLPVISVKGRKYTKYDPNVALDIVERLAEGELLSDICARNAVPRTVARSTFLRWVSTVPELSKAYAAAQRISALALEEKALSFAVEMKDKPGTPQRVSAGNAYLSQLRWSAARRDPTKYSDKGNTTVVVPVNISTSLDLGNATGKVDVEVPDMYNLKIEDAEFEEVQEEQKEITKEQLSTLLRTDEPVKGTSHQPLLQYQRKVADNTGPRKRVLRPRNPSYTKA